jgi:hypothetical protein
MTSLEPVSSPDPKPQKPASPYSTAQIVGGVPGTVLAFIVALTTAIQAYTQYQETQAISRATYETLKVATDRNTEQLAAQNHELKQLRTWVQAIARAVKEQQQMSHAPEREKVASTPPDTLEEPTLAPTLPNFEELKKD